MRQDYSRMLEECLRLMQTGTPMEECLMRFPDHADELRPHLAMADRLSRARPTDPPDGALQRGKDRLMAALTEQEDPRAVELVGGSFWFPMPLRQALAPLRRLSLPYQLAAAAATVFLMAGAVMGASAAGGDPGSPLRSWFSSESSSDVPSSLSTPSPTPTPAATAVPTPEAEIKGVIDSVSDDSFVVSGVTVTLTPDTRFDDFDGHPLAAGQRVEAHGLLQTDASVLAARVELEDEDAQDVDDHDSTVTPTPTPDDDDEGDDNDDHTVTPTPQSGNDDHDADEDDDDNQGDDDDDDRTVTPTSTPDDHNGDEDDGDGD